MNYIDYESIELIHDTNNAAIALYDGGWTSNDHDQLLQEYYRDLYRDDFDFEMWKSQYPKEDVESLDDLRKAVEDSIDEIIECIAGIEKGE